MEDNQSRRDNQRQPGGQSHGQVRTQPSHGGGAPSSGFNLNDAFNVVQPFIENPSELNSGIVEDEFEIRKRLAGEVAQLKSRSETAVHNFFDQVANTLSRRNVGLDGIVNMLATMKLIAYKKGQVDRGSFPLKNSYNLIEKVVVDCIISSNEQERGLRLKRFSEFIQRLQKEAEVQGA